MRTYLVNVIGVARASRSINRIARHASAYGIAKALHITPPRAKNLIDSAIETGLIFAYDNSHTFGDQSIRYGITEMGETVLSVIDEETGNKLI